MSKTQVEVITSVQRRRRWAISEKERIVAAALEPGAVASEVARAAGIHVSQLFRWRQQLCGAERAAPRFAPVAVVPEPSAGSATETIEIEFGRGVRMRIIGACDASIVKVMVGALAKIGRRR
ncbi:MAG TPA: transposase [Xanthobacteraceae bacterium]|jgi:transposase|nr:transposase [Xanthobacteraceae bacterium]